MSVTLVIRDKELSRQLRNATAVGLKRAAVYFHARVRAAVNRPNTGTRRKRKRTTVAGKKGSGYTTYDRPSLPGEAPKKPHRARAEPDRLGVQRRHTRPGLPRGRQGERPLHGLPGIGHAAHSPKALALGHARAASRHAWQTCRNGRERAGRPMTINQAILSLWSEHPELTALVPVASVYAGRVPVGTALPYATIEQPSAAAPADRTRASTWTWPSVSRSTPRPTRPGRRQPTPWRMP